VTTTLLDPRDDHLHYSQSQKHENLYRQHPLMHKAFCSKNTAQLFSP
jgi:hypothetical protein